MMAIPSSGKMLSFKQVSQMPELQIQKNWILATCGGTIGNVVYVDSLKHFEWRDLPWVAVAGTIRNGMVDLDVASVDTLMQIVHRVPKRFLFFRYGTKAIRQEVVSKNPHTRIVYSEYIELK